MKQNKVWIFGILTAFCLSGCGVLPQQAQTEIKQSMAELENIKNEMGQTINDVKTEVVQELKDIHWAQEVFLIGDTVEREKLVLTRTDLQEPQTITETKDFIANMNVKEWKKVDTLPTDKTPLAVYDIERTFDVEMNGHHTEKTLILANMIVYDGYVQLKVLDGVTKYLNDLIPKDAFFVTYETDKSVTDGLVAFGTV